MTTDEDERAAIGRIQETVRIAEECSGRRTLWFVNLADLRLLLARATRPHD
jgi:hypothetical protein